MKTLKYISIILFIGTLFTACTEKFEEINTDPDHPTDTDPNYIFNYVLKEGAAYFGMDNDYYNRRNWQQWIMYTSPFGNSKMPPYADKLPQDQIKSIWQYFYSNLGSNCHLLVDMTSENPEDSVKHQIAKIWKIYNFHKVTDLWGDVPYSEAWQLLDGYSPEASKPIYDKQEDIYASFLSDLKQASNVMENSTQAGYQNDELFSGNTTLWVKFANSLRLRLAVRSGNSAVVSEIVNEDNLISNNTENAIYEYIESQNWWNPYYDAEINSKNPIDPEAIGSAVPKISRLMELQLKETNDPRLFLFASPTEQNDTLYVGVPNLLDGNKKEDQALRLSKRNTSYIGSYFFGSPTLKKPLITYSEVCFLRAEAAVRGWTGEDAQTWFQEGMRSSLEFYEVNDTEITDFIADNPFENTIEQIMEQKWVALFMDGWESFSEYRRTGYPQLMKWDMVINTGPPITITDTTWVEVPRSYVPGRIPYPNNESDFNGENYEKALNDMGLSSGGDQIEPWYYEAYNQVWWSKLFGEVNY